MISFPLRKLMVLSLSSASLFTALAQTTTPPTTTPPTTTPPAATPTCTTAPASISALTLERTVALSGISATATPNIPASLRSALTSGALEFRQQFSLNPTTNVLTVTDFAAQPGSASPTAPQNMNFNNVFSSETFNVDKIYSSCKPTPSLLITGTISQNFPVSPIGNLVGVPAAISIGYTTDNPPKVTNAIIVYAGIGSIFTPTATGTLTFPAGSVTPPGTNQGPAVVIAGGINQSTAQKQISLDASGSTSTPAGLQLTYVWTQVNSNQAAAINNPNTATPLITFAGGKGTYIFEVTVTDSKGNSSKQQVTIEYNGL
jgi:hypothetical protein